jgi:hypothetical protein
MDPDAALRDLRAALEDARAAAEGDSNDAEIEAWQAVGDEIEALDEWLSKGGFLPLAWQNFGGLKGSSEDSGGTA